MKFRARNLAKAAALLALAGTLGAALTRSSGQEGAAIGPPNGLGLRYVPMPVSFKFRPPGEVQKWIDENDARAINGHAWDLWGGLTTLTTEKVDGRDATYPIFETWFDEDTVFAPPLAADAAAAKPGAKARPFSQPKQLLHSPAGRARLRAASTPGVVSPQVPLFVTVKYTKEIFDQVRANQYNNPSVLEALNRSWDASNPATPIRDRSLKPFPDRSIMLKPTYQIVSGTEATIAPYWTGPADSTSPTTPDPTTWTKKMLIVPPGAQATKAEGVTAVPLDRFYHFKINAEEAEIINQQVKPTAVRAGDYALLVAMHVSSREIDDWTWQTFFWSFDRPKIPAEQRSKVKPPFDNYQAAVGYSFTEGPDSPTGLNVVCFNPYLEAGFDSSAFAKPGQLGIESNCMSCHRAATWPDPQPLQSNYIANGLIDPGDPFFFKGLTKTDFVWGVGSDVKSPKAAAQAAPRGR